MINFLGQHRGFICLSSLNCDRHQFIKFSKMILEPMQESG